METILFSHVNVFDGEQQCLLTDRDVLIADGIIRSVSAGGSGSASAQETVDARGMTLPCQYCRADYRGAEVRRDAENHRIVDSARRL